MIAYILTSLTIAGLIVLTSLLYTKHLYKDLKIKFLKSYRDQDYFKTYEAQKMATPSFTWENNLDFGTWIIEKSPNMEQGKDTYSIYLEYENTVEKIGIRLFWRLFLILITWMTVTPFFFEFPSWGSRFFGNEMCVIRTNSNNTRVKEVFPLPHTGIFQLPFDDVREHIIAVSNSNPGFEKTKAVHIAQTINGDPREFNIEFALKTEDYLKFLIQVNNSGEYKSCSLQDEALVFNNFQSIVEKSSLPAKELAYSLGELFNKWLTDQGITSAQVKVLRVTEYSDRKVQMH